MPCSLRCRATRHGRGNRDAKIRKPRVASKPSKSEAVARLDSGRSGNSPHLLGGLKVLIFVGAVLARCLNEDLGKPQDAASCLNDPY